MGDQKPSPLGKVPSRRRKPPSARRMRFPSIALRAFITGGAAEIAFYPYRLAGSVRTSSVFDETMQAFFVKSTFPRGEGKGRAAQRRPYNPSTAYGGPPPLGASTEAGEARAAATIPIAYSLLPIPSDEVSDKSEFARLNFYLIEIIRRIVCEIPPARRRSPPGRPAP